MMWLISYRLNETDFMEFSEVENHDDFYTLDDGRIHVQDQRGYYIVYDASIKDLEYVYSLIIFGT